MSLCTRAAQRLHHLYSRVLLRERIRNTEAYQVWLALHGPPRMEQLEQRLMLSGDSPKTLVAAEMSHVDEIKIRGDAINPLTGDPYGLTGQGITLGIWELGDVDTSHELLTPRVTDRDGFHELRDHATNVAGVMVAAYDDGMGIAGMAPANEP